MQRNKVLYHDIVYIDPADCSSSVGFKILSEFLYYEEKPQYRLAGTVNISDCSRIVEWLFAEEKEAIDKIDAAISMLQKFRELFALELKNKGIS
jgi:hypothetical protein